MRYHKYRESEFDKWVGSRWIIYFLIGTIGGLIAYAVVIRPDFSTWVNLDAITHLFVAWAFLFAFAVVWYIPEYIVFRVVKRIRARGNEE